ncbi:putative ribonuclease H-like domain-containing protein [Tanacetum coccineum]|uniref:Ribonuclease H-like domain-containing protein n=1 Tax=Tanacetum coccineum TaxID=301880 RepID=A0ABQ5C9C8_9ASTR
MTLLVAISTLDSANFCVMQGASCTQREVSMVFLGRISPNSFCLYAAVGGIVDVVVFSFIFKLSFVLIDSFLVLEFAMVLVVLLVLSYGMIHEDGDNDAISGNDDERAIIQSSVRYHLYVLLPFSQCGEDRVRLNNSRHLRLDELDNIVEEEDEETDSLLRCTANLSDDTVYALLASQPNGSQLVYEDLEQIHEDDIEEIDLKCHRNKNQDSSRRTINVEETSSKAMVAIDGAGFDWSYMADDEVPTNMALMAFSDSKVHNDKTCSKTCLKSFKTLKTQLDDLRIEFNKSEFNLATYKRGLASVEEQLVFYKKNEVIFCEQLAVLKRDISYKDSELSMLKSELEKLKQEKESNQLKIKKFDNASKSLDKLIGSQITDKSRKGVGFVSYSAVPPPPIGLFSPLKFNLSNSGLEEFQQPETSRNLMEICLPLGRMPKNRVLVVKPQNKTPYELFRGRTPALSFIRPFGCYVTIFNTLEYVGKFDGKSDEGFFVGYSLIRGKITGKGTLKTVVAGTNSNDLVGTKESIDAGHSNKEIRSSQDCILMPLWKDGSLFDSYSKNASNDEPQPSSDAGKKDDEGVNKESGIDDQERYENSTQDVNTVGPSINTASTNVNTGSININTVSPTVTTALLETTHADFYGDETELDMSNITTIYLVPFTPNTRIHKDHSLDHVISDVQSGVLTRRMTKTTNEQGFISAFYEGKTHEDLHTCLFVYFLSQEEPKKVIQALKDLSWIEAMQEELFQFKNKKDERGIMIRNKARLVAQGYTQEKGIDYDKMDVKSAFLYGKIEEEIYVYQPPGYEDLEFPDRVYSVEKALYGLHQAPRAWYETLSTYLLDNGFQREIDAQEVPDEFYG